MKTLEDKLNELSHSARATVDARAQQLRDQLDTVDELRRLYATARASTGKSQNLTPAEIAKAEKDSDALLAVLRGYVETMGGSLKIIAEFPGKDAVILNSLLDLADKN